MKRYAQVAEVSVVTPELSNLNKSVGTAILTMIPERGPDLTTCLKGLIRTNKPLINATESVHGAARA